MKKKATHFKTQLQIPNVPSGTVFVLYDPVLNYCIDHFGAENTLILFWNNPWKTVKNWRTIKKRLIGMRFNGTRKPQLLQVYFHGFWKANYAFNHTETLYRTLHEARFVCATDRSKNCVPKIATGLENAMIRMDANQKEMLGKK